jgi:hypothetical protein
MKLENIYNEALQIGASRIFVGPFQAATPARFNGSKRFRKGRWYINGKPASCAEVEKALNDWRNTVSFLQ